MATPKIHFDEVDAFEFDSGGEGDPIGLALDRSHTIVVNADIQSFRRELFRVILPPNKMREAANAQALSARVLAYRASLLDTSMQGFAADVSDEIGDRPIEDDYAPPCAEENEFMRQSEVVYELDVTEGYLIEEAYAALRKVRGE